MFSSYIFTLTPFGNVDMSPKRGALASSPKKSLLAKSLKRCRRTKDPERMPSYNVLAKVMSYKFRNFFMLAPVSCTKANNFITSWHGTAQSVTIPNTITLFT